MDQHLGQNVGVALVADRMTGERALALLVHFERWDADHLARFDAGIGLHPAAIDTDLPDFLDILAVTVSAAVFADGRSQDPGNGS